MTKRFAGILAAIVLLCGAFSNASASAIETFTGGGSIDFAAAGNPFGISLGDTVSWSTSYDPAWITGDFVAIGTNYPAGARLQHNIGSLTFDEINDYQFSDQGLPDVFVVGDQPEGFDFIVDYLFDNVQYTYNALESGFSIYEFVERTDTPDPNDIDPSLFIVSGTFNDLAAVPVPAAVWLLGSGLVGLAGLRRRLNR